LHLKKKPIDNLFYFSRPNAALERSNQKTLTIIKKELLQCLATAYFAGWWASLLYISESLLERISTFWFMQMVLYHLNLFLFKKILRILEENFKPFWLIFKNFFKFYICLLPRRVNPWTYWKETHARKLHHSKNFT